jgi:hypothetical protein
LPISNVIDIADVMVRAAARVPGPIAERSVERFQRSTLHAPRFTLDVATPDPDPTLGLLRIGKREGWCLGCGETVSPDGFCQRCGSRRYRPVAEILTTDEYYIAA